MSDYTLLVVPTKGVSNENACMVKIESRHVSKVPQQGNKEIAFDTGLDPTMFEDHVSAAGSITKLISNGRRYEALRDTIVSNLGDAADIVLDLKGGTPEISESSRYGLYEVALDRLRCIGKAVGINL